MRRDDRGRDLHRDRTAGRGTAVGRGDGRARGLCRARGLHGWPSLGMGRGSARPSRMRAGVGAPGRGEGRVARGLRCGGPGGRAGAPRPAGCGRAGGAGVCPLVPRRSRGSPTSGRGPASRRRLLKLGRRRPSPVVRLAGGPTRWRQCAQEPARWRSRQASGSTQNPRTPPHGPMTWTSVIAPHASQSLVSVRSISPPLARYSSQSAMATLGRTASASCRA